jgi:hypothetical protein
VTNGLIEQNNWLRERGLCAIFGTNLVMIFDPHCGQVWDTERPALAQGANLADAIDAYERSFKGNQ